MKNRRRLLIFALFASSAALLVIIICAHQFRWGKYLPVQNITPEEMVSRLKTSNVMSVAVDTNIYHSFDPHNHQGIHLETKLGFRYFTKWKPKPGTDYENTTSSWDLVIQILEKERGLVRYKDFRLTNPQLGYNSRI